MKPLKILRKVTLLLVVVGLAACTQDGARPRPESALGDSPTLTGKIANLSKAKVEGKTLTVKATAYLVTTNQIGTLAESTVSADGSFSLTLPGESNLKDFLSEAKVENQQTQCGAVTPTSYKTMIPPTLELYADGTLVATLRYANSDNLARVQSEVTFMFVDRDVSIKGECSFFRDDKITYDMRLHKGWNSVIFSFDSTKNSGTMKAAKPDASFSWLLGPLLTPSP
jgi:hypothetical protein